MRVLHIPIVHADDVSKQMHREKQLFREWLRRVNAFKNGENVLQQKGKLNIAISEPADEDFCDWIF